MIEGPAALVLLASPVVFLLGMGWVGIVHGDDTYMDTIHGGSSIG